MISSPNDSIYTFIFIDFHFIPVNGVRRIVSFVYYLKNKNAITAIEVLKRVAFKQEISFYLIPMQGIITVERRLGLFVSPILNRNKTVCSTG